ncbi:Isoflavone reductase-like protein [Ceratobasidium theobromae]|uniref:Isoflavone reductase-like protein n=1 Tax=Ceratobasidium theobromae TaxID=1582974 RepID=A0A5N5QWY4_9AGAM|nr:Isoflavone reductase-like protein [Ceratobasidium theobromae]
MSAKIVALAGANGYVGKAFANALLDVDASQLRILTRAESVDSPSLQEFKTRGASLHIIAYDSEASIVKALEGVDVLISTVASAVLVHAQVPLIKAAKAAGVKTFFPSEYGALFEDESDPSPVVQAKKEVIRTTKEAGLPITIVSNGAFPEYCINPYFGFSFADKKVTIWGDGNAKVAWTSARSVADWVANVLKTVPVEQLQNKHLRIRGTAASPNDIVRIWEKKHNDKLEVDYHSTQELEDRLKANNGDFLATLILELSSGKCELDAHDNGLYPDWKPDALENFL